MATTEPHSVGSIEGRSAHRAARSRRRRRRRNFDLRKVSQYSYLLLVSALLLPVGAVDALPLHLLSSVILVVSLFAVLLNDQERLRGAIPHISLILAVLIGWIVMQATVTLPIEPGSVWAEANALHGPLIRKISLSPADSLQTIVPVVLPFAIFAAVISLFRDDEAAVRLFKFVGISGGVVAVLSLLQFVFTPDNLFFERKLFYLSSLTGVFVNRNTAATYFGMVALLNFGLFMLYLNGYGRKATRKPVERTESALTDFKVLMLLVLAILCFAALVLTKSRAGILISSVFLMLFFMLSTFFPSRATDRDRSTKSLSLLMRVGRVVLVGLVLLAVELMLFQRLIYRVQVAGVEDARFCVYKSVANALGDYWLTGNGIGTFKLFYPTIRNPECGIHGIFERAHNIYLEGFLGLGIIFPVVLVYVLFLLVRIFWQGARDRRRLRPLVFAGIAIFGLQLLHNGVDFSLQIPAVAAIFAAILGAVSVISLARAK